MVQHGVVLTAANIDPTWIECEIEKLLEKRSARRRTSSTTPTRPASVSCTTAPGRDEDGLVILTTLGTGIGSAIIYRNVLVPNSELGHLEIDGKDAEDEAASSAKTRAGLTYDEWVQRLQRYYRLSRTLFSPDLFVVGGGISKERPVPARCSSCARRSSRPRSRTRPASSARPGSGSQTRSARQAQGLTRATRGHSPARNSVAPAPARSWMRVSFDPSWPAWLR